MHLKIGFLLLGILVLAMLVSSASAQDEIENLLTNPDFENGTTGWSFGGVPSIDFDEEPVGGFGQVAYFNALVVGPENWNPEIHSPPFNLANGKKYTYSFWAKAGEEGAGRTLGPRFEQLDTWVGMGQDITVGEDWQEYHFTGVWTNPSSPPAVVIHIGWNLQEGGVWFSHFRVYEGEWIEEDIEIEGQKKISVTPMGRLATAWGQIKSR